MLKFQSSYIQLYCNTTTPICLHVVYIHCHCMGADLTVTETIWHWKPKTFSIWPFAEEVCWPLTKRGKIWVGKNHSSWHFYCRWTLPLFLSLMWDQTLSPTAENLVGISWFSLITLSNSSSVLFFVFCFFFRFFHFSCKIHIFTIRQTAAGAALFQLDILIPLSPSSFGIENNFRDFLFNLFIWKMRTLLLYEAKLVVQPFSFVWLFVTPWTVAR